MKKKLCSTILFCTLLMLCFHYFNILTVHADTLPPVNVYSEPFLAKYYPGQTASVKTSSGTYETGWHYDQAGVPSFYMITDKTYYASGWKELHGKWYYFDDNGYTVKGWIRTNETVQWAWYARPMYYDPLTAARVTGYKMIQGVGRYFKENGYLFAANYSPDFTINGQSYLIDHAAICSIMTPQVPLVSAKDAGLAIAGETVHSVDGSYSFRAEINKNTVIEPFGSNYVCKNSSKEYAFLINSDNYKGRFGAWYRNVGTYNGRVIDVKYTITDYTRKSIYAPEDGILWARSNSIGISFKNLDNATGQMEFFDHETGELVSIKGYATINDIDFCQACEIISPVDNLTIASDSVLNYGVINNHPVFVMPLSQYIATNDDETKAMVQVDFEGTFFAYTFHDNRTFYKNDQNYSCYNGQSLWNLSTDPSLYSSDGNWQGYTARRLARISIPSPAKTVSDQDELDVTENTLSSLSEMYRYKISQNVPAEQEEYYWNSYKIEDTLAPGITYVSANVTDDSGADVSDLFHVQIIDGQTVVWEAKNTKSSAFYDRNYHFEIQVKPNLDYDFSTYFDAEHQCIMIPNKATAYINDSTGETSSLETNTVSTNLVHLSINKVLSVEKVSSADQTPLSDAEFTIYEWSEKTKEYTSIGQMKNQGNGIYTMENLTYSLDNSGKYKIQESKVPNGYEGSFTKEIQFDAKTDSQTIHCQASNIPILPKADISVKKMDAATKEPLTDAEFSVYEWDKNQNTYKKDPIEILFYEDNTQLYKCKNLLARTDSNLGKFLIIESKIPQSYAGKWQQEFTVDGNPGQINDLAFEVYNTHLLDLTINKTLYTRDLLWAHGEPTFLFCISGTDVNGGAHTYYRSITFTQKWYETQLQNQETIQLSTVIQSIPSGTYTVREIPVQRYRTTDIIAESDNVSVNKKADATYGSIQTISGSGLVDLTKKHASITFVNRKVLWNQFSHTDTVINHFKK